ncbi:hypothetical protein DFH11DRAFT_1733233 [Phellopilus nigrolimitatus]|nr:hypothetical protein DFH11DRAFT_1733233 [Phellopilus nigrolimitatus]
MRESNFAFPALTGACVWNRRALDTTSPLPLLNSLTHLTYFTSSLPRIREILTCDGGLERLSVPNVRVRELEPVRSRVVQAGTLEVVACVLEAWLALSGFDVGPSVSASGIPRETREQRKRRRQQLESASERRHMSSSVFLRENGLSTNIGDGSVNGYFRKRYATGSRTPTPSASTSRPNSETEDDADVEMDVDDAGSGRGREHAGPTIPFTSTTDSSPTRHPQQEQGAAGVVVAGASDTVDVDVDTHMIINTHAADNGV